MAVFSDSDLQAIAQIFGDPGEGLPEPDIADILRICGIMMELSSANISQRLFEALTTQQATDGNRRRVLAFLRVAMDPERHGGDRERFERYRASLNEQLLLSGIQVDGAGSLEPASGNLVNRLWRGEIPLATTFWLYGFLGGISVGLPSFVLATYSPGSPALIVFSLISVFYLLFVLVAVWRSAGKYNGPMSWASLARGWVILNIALMVIRLFR